jgi:hypothetical protein
VRVSELDDLYRLNAPWDLPASVHPASLVDAIREVAARHPDKWDDGGKDRLVARVAIELGCSWHELAGVEDLTTGLNEAYTPGAPLRFDGLSREYWSLLDDLSAQGWTWDTTARAIGSMYDNHLSAAPF